MLAAAARNACTALCTGRWSVHRGSACCSVMPCLSSRCAGKVHGSLARAGKVRGQCPKVPKQEKKKQPKVRAVGGRPAGRQVVPLLLCGSVVTRDQCSSFCTAA
jgi:small subunit ribosomal protein S30e